MYAYMYTYLYILSKHTTISQWKIKKEKPKTSVCFLIEMKGKKIKKLKTKKLKTKNIQMKNKNIIFFL